MSSTSRCDSSPAIGIVVTVYNGAGLVSEALQSLQEQTYPNWQCVVVDDGSSDDGAEVVAQIAATDPRISLHRQVNAGVGAARNTGLALLPQQLELVGFLDHDDTYMPHAFSVLVDELRARPDAVGAFGLAEYIDEATHPIWPGLHPRRQLDRRAARGYHLEALSPSEDTTFDDLIVYNPVWPPATALFRHSAVDAVGGFSTQKSQQDADFYLRLVRSGPLAVVPRQVAWYRRIGGNTTDRTLTYLLQRESLIHVAWRSPANTAAHRRSQRYAGRRLRASEVKRGLRALQSSLREGDLKAVVLGVLGTLWVMATVLPAHPPRPSARRIRWSRGIDESTSWDVSSFGS